jgi:hypothetical protein
MRMVNIYIIKRICCRCAQQYVELCVFRRCIFPLTLATCLLFSCVRLICVNWCVL